MSAQANGKPRSQKRRIKDAKATVEIAGDHYNPVVRFSVAPFHEPHKAVTFELPFWKWKRLREDVAQIGAVAKQRLEGHARVIAEQVGIQQ